MKTQFPKLPEYGFSWRSVQVEPIPNSDERITIGSVVKGEDGALIAAKFLTHQRLKKMYGAEFGKRIADALALCVASAEKYYLNHSLSTQWTPPLEGFYLGKERFSHANNIEDGLNTSAMHCSSFSVALDAGKLESSKESDLSAPEYWRRRIMDAVKLNRSDFDPYFQKEVTMQGSELPFKFDFISDRYAAHFDAITTHRKFQQALVRAQSKLWQLDRLREEDILYKDSLCELLLETPPNTSRDANDVSEFVAELKYEASRREISIYASSSSEDAARHLISRAA